MKKSSIIEKIQCRRKKTSKSKKIYRKNYNSRQNKQKQKVYATKKSEEQSKKYNSFTSKSYEKIDFEKKFDEKESSDAYFYNITSNSPEICKKCDIKKKTFIFNNKFHDHVRKCVENVKKKSILKKKTFDLSIIKSFAFTTIKNDLSFRFYHYASV